MTQRWRLREPFCGLSHLAGVLLSVAGLVALFAVVLALDRPCLWPAVSGCHDLWHLLVLGGSACYFVVIRCFVAAAP